MKYNPEIAPIPAAWLALDESERIELCIAFHKKTKEKPPNLKLHAIIHAVVENQLAGAI